MWALDLGTTNSLLARWDTAADTPALLEMPEIPRRCTKNEIGDPSRAVPSALHVFDAPTFWARLGPVSHRLLIGPTALIGREAPDMNLLRHRPHFVPTFKRQLARAPLSTVARARGRAISAREAVYLYVRDLLTHSKRASGPRIRDLLITSPVDAE